MNRLSMLPKIAVVAFVVSFSFAAEHIAPYEDLATSLSGVSGDAVTISVYNSGAETETARFRVTVRLSDNSTEVLTSGVVSIDSGDTAALDVHASTTVASVLDGPTPIEP